MIGRKSRDKQPFDFDWLVIGSGFGGSVSSLRLAEKGYRVGLLECGRRYDDDDLPESSWDFRRAIWMPRIGLRGLMRVSWFKDIAVLTGSGVGGGSLVYSNVLYRPPPEFFDDPRWAGPSDWWAELEPFYTEAERMLGVVIYKHEGPADALLRQVAGDLGVADTYQKPPVAVFMGEPGVTVEDPFFGGEGPARTGCTLCGGCMVGCRDGAKNTLPKNYLWFAERHGVRIMPEKMVTDIRPLGLSADGSEGYAVSIESPGLSLGKRRRVLTAGGVIVSAGTLGTNKLLQRCRLNGSLPAMSARLGEQVRTNSESVLAITAPDDRFDFSEAISITSSIFPDANTHIEPVTYGRKADAQGSLFTVMPKIGARRTQPLRFLLALLRNPRKALRVMSPHGWSRRTMLIIVMQTIDASIRLRPARRARDGSVMLATEVDPDHERPAPIPIAHDVAKRLAEKMGGTAQASIFEAALSVPITAHFLGGAVIGTDPEHGVVDQNQHVFGYKNLLICDGSVLPANIGVNPSLTITALAERAISRIPAVGDKSQDGELLIESGDEASESQPGFAMATDAAG